MSSKLERIYSNMPVFLQNMAVSLQGWLYNRKRYTGKYCEYVDKLMRSQWFSAEQFREMQVIEFRKLLKDVMQNVPYYRDMLSKYSGKIDDIDLDSIREIPLLEKSLLRENTEQFIDKSRLKYGHDDGHTSGTSGFPLVWPYDLDSLKYDLAFRERQYRWAGLTGREKSARFSGRLLLGKHQDPPYWRYNKTENQWLFSAYHITDETVSLYYKAFEDFGLHFLDGYPSALFTIAKWINQQNKSGSWRPWAIFATAETLLDFQKDEIEQAFGSKIFNFYSSSEGAPFITQCEAGSMHLNPESGIVEFLRPDGTPAEPGEEAEMVVTSFFQRTMPLIRYRIGDTGALAQAQSCPCGRQMPIVKYIGGRESDTLYTTERGMIGSAGLSTVFYKIPSRINGSQLEQIDNNSFVFRYVPLNKPLTEQEKAVVYEQFKSRLGSSVTIDIQIVKEIPKSANGKSRLIIGMKKSNRGE